MNTAHTRFLFRFLLLITIPFNSTAHQHEKNTIHPVTMACNECHLAGEKISKKNAALLTNTQTELCANCHTDAMDIGHPYGFQPEQSLPAEFPLGDQDKLTCSTCHDVHGKSDSYLRTDKRGLDFCQSCHNQAFFLRMKDQGLSLVTSTHFNTKKYNNPAGPDDPSIQCLGCHDDNNYSLDDDFFIGTMMHTSGMSGNHRIGVLYASYQSYGGYITSNNLSRKINLPDGKLSCVSCHKGYSKNHGSLVISNSGSALCYSCHDL